jgi:antitoxin (DNA-binding transcriptional repressor) of toxin-antitoxin stability system
MKKTTEMSTELTDPTPSPPSKTFCIIPTFVVTLFLEVRKMKFVGVREFKQDVVKYLNGGNEIVVMKRKKPIARLTPVEKDSAEIILLEIGRVLNEAGVSKKEALKALDQARKKIYG